MKAVVIHEKGVSEVIDLNPGKETDEGMHFERYNEIIGSEMFDAVCRRIGGTRVSIYVDDEGALPGGETDEEGNELPKREPVAVWRDEDRGEVVEVLFGTIIITGLPDGEGWCVGLTDAQVKEIMGHIGVTPDGRHILLYGGAW